MNPMPIKGKVAFASILLSAMLISGCKSSTEVTSNSHTQPAGTNSDPAKTSTPPAEPDANGVISSGTGVEKEKPAAGKGNVQGKAFYNGQPAVGVEAKLCKTFSQYLGGCSGETYTAKTDSAGEYLIKNVPPGIYEGLIVKVFDTPYFVFATSGLVQSAKYKIEEGQTFFAPDTHLFKSDLKLLNPKAGSKIGANNIEVKWEPYPDAAYYKFSIYADSSTGAETQYDYINKRVDGQSYVLDKPLSPGSYTCKVVAYNGNDTKLSESADDIKFAVTGGAGK
jgi:hypothetical protein